MTNLFTNADFTNMFEPVQKLVDLNISKFEAIVEAQTAATKSFVEQSEATIKAASEVKDYDGLAAFMQEQTKTAQTNMEKMIADSKSVAEEMIAYSREIQQIVGETVEASKPAKKPTAKKAA